jgi:hypothetical protein
MTPLGNGTGDEWQSGMAWKVQRMNGWMKDNNSTDNSHGGGSSTSLAMRSEEASGH